MKIFNTRAAEQKINVIRREDLKWCLTLRSVEDLDLELLNCFRCFLWLVGLVLPHKPLAVSSKLLICCFIRLWYGHSVKHITHEKCISISASCALDDILTTTLNTFTYSLGQLEIYSYLKQSAVKHVSFMSTNTTQILIIFCFDVYICTFLFLYVIFVYRIEWFCVFFIFFCCETIWKWIDEHCSPD